MVLFAMAQKLNYYVCNINPLIYGNPEGEGGYFWGLHILTGEQPLH